MTTGRYLYHHGQGAVHHPRVHHVPTAFFHHQPRAVVHVAHHVPACHSATYNYHDHEYKVHNVGTGPFIVKEINSAINAYGK